LAALAPTAMRQLRGVGMTYRVLSLFAGIGGFDLGLERTGGFKTVAFCEIDKAARAILRKHWPRVPVYPDVRELTEKALRHDGMGPNCIVGGFPCQDLSTSGSGLGLRGERSGLWAEYARLIREIRPRYIIVENSPELLAGWMGEVLGTLAELGYDAEWEVIPAWAVGAPHRRERIWIVACPAGVGSSRPWGLVESITPATDAYREASGLKRAFQRRELPYVCGGHDGLSPYVDRAAIKALGNAVVPQIPELIGRAILAAEAA
jgi:DNA (cytosine-5)-methyltransferase 1